jgi:RimJ/RimL family protein N-acetyltransferase
MFNIEQQVEWLNDKQVVKYSEQRHREHTLESQHNFLRIFDHTNNHVWEISHRHHCYDYPIGTATAMRDMMNKVATIGLLIGNREIWGKGYGSEAWQGIMDAMFADGIEKIEAGTLDVNYGMLRIMEKCGMKLEGRRPSHIIIDSEPHDIVLMGKVKCNPTSK